MMKKLNCAVIGLGVGEKHVESYHLHKDCELKAVCDFNKTKLKEIKNKHKNIFTTEDANEIINSEDIDIISIASYDNFHAEQIIGSLDNQKHIFIEKPICQTKDEFEDIISAIKRNPEIKLSSNLILRCTPRFKELKKVIDNNELGKPYYIEASYDYGRIHKIINGWRGELDFYSVMHGGGIHMIDLITWLMDSKIQKVYANGTNISTLKSNFKFFDCISASLIFDNGAIGNITANFGSVIPHGHRLAVYGTQKTFHHGPLGAAYFSERDPKAKIKSIITPYPGANKGDLIPSFINHIFNSEIPPLVTKDDVLNSMAISLAIEESLSLGQPQDVEYPLLNKNH